MKIFRPSESVTKQIIDRQIIDKLSGAALEENEPLSDEDAMEEAKRVYQRYPATMRKLAQ